MRYTSILTFLLTTNWLFAQLPNISKRWENEFIEQKGELYKFQKLGTSVFENDFSKIIGNQVRMKGDGWSTFIGVFGPKNRRIDFHLNAEKVTNTKYRLQGKSKLGSNIRELKGTIDLQYALSTGWEYANIIVFHFNLKEPGDKNGDGEFNGIGAFAFYIEDSKPEITWSAAGDFREYNNMFVGVWNRYNSDVARECIFTFHPSGTHTKLPFRNHLYKEFDELDECQCFFEFKDEIRKYGWENYDDDNIQKTGWWKN
jgi:hypothetical protein